MSSSNLKTQTARKRPPGPAPSAPGKRPALAPQPLVLLTGFDPFGGSEVNPSWLAVQTLHGRKIAGHRVVCAQLPTRFAMAPGELARLVRLHRPVLVICVGQAGGRGALSLERIAINLSDASLPDNAGVQARDERIVPEGPAAYFSTLPVKNMLTALQREGLAAEISLSAGSFVCNHVFYVLMHMLATQRGFKRTRGGFIHVPYLPQQGLPNMPLDKMTHGLRIAIRCALNSPGTVK